MTFQSLAVVCGRLVFGAQGAVSAILDSAANLPKNLKYTSVVAWSFAFAVRPKVGYNGFRVVQLDQIPGSGGAF
jgi:hypothetical protein